MTFRAILLGILGAVAMGAGGQYVNKYIPGARGLIRGHLPVSMFGLMIFFSLLVNPLLGKIRASWRFRPAEIALVMALVLVACGIADAGLMRQIPKALIHPVLMNRTNPGWQRAGLLEETPSGLLVNDGQFDDRIIEDYVTPMGEPGKPIPFRAVPWHAWHRPLTIWGGIFLLVAIGTVSLGVLVHRQWADRERIRYPLADLTHSLLAQDEQGRTAILRSRLFRLGLAVPLFIRIVNGIYLWTDNKTVEIPMTLDFSALAEGFPEFMSTPGAGSLMNLTFYPACIGFTYLLASDIGFSLGIATFLNVLVLYLLLLFGVNTSGGVIEGGVIEAHSFGSFLAMALMLLYVGRRYYWQTAKQAVTFRPQQETDAAGVWALRTLLLAVGGTVAILCAIGLDWPIALMAVLGTLLLFFIMARINAECGVFFLAPAWQMPVAIVGLFGLTTLGPRTIIVLGLLMFILSIDPFECMMPFVVNGLKIASGSLLKPGRVGLLMAVAIGLTLAVTIPTALWADYNHAANMRRGWGSEAIFNVAEKSASQLEALGERETVRQYGTWDRLRAMRPDSRFLIPMASGFLLLIGCSLLRLRFTWWPLHPVILLLFGAMLFGRFSFSFLLGWAIKMVVSKFGGAAKYTETKPLMIGVIAGDLLGGFLFMIVAWIYFAVTGTAGKEMMLW